MSFGYNGKIARIDLTVSEITIEEHDWHFYRTYMGGRGFILYYLLNEVPPETDPLSIENLLIFAPSVMTGVPLAGFGRHSVGAKSPLTGYFGETEAGGFWGVELKFAGFDALVVKGKAPRPVYLHIRDGDIQLRDASALWGLDTGETKNAIIRETGEEKLKALLIGKAGE